MATASNMVREMGTLSELSNCTLAWDSINVAGQHINAIHIAATPPPPEKPPFYSSPQML